MRWNWTQPDWPDFRYERKFLLSSGEILGAVRHVTAKSATVCASSF